jgi:hypothetical protein
MQAKDGVGNSNNQPIGYSNLVVFDQPKEVAEVTLIGSFSVRMRFIPF